MSASETRAFRLVDDAVRQRAKAAIDAAPVGYTVSIRPASRSLDQNAAIHGYCAQIAKARPEWNGMAMDAEDWKALLIVSHAVATTASGVRLVPDLEGKGLVQLRESSARMSRDRASSLLEYIAAWAAAQGITLVNGDDRP